MTRPTLREFGPSLVSLTLVMTLSAVLFIYAWGPNHVWSAQAEYFPGLGTSENRAEELVVGVVLSSLIIFAPLLLITRRWRTPFGTATIVLFVTQTALSVGLDEDLLAVPAMVVAGLAVDAVVARRAPRWMLATAGPAALWLAFYFLIARTADGLGTAPEIWTGSVLLAVMAVAATEAGLSAAADLGGATASHAVESESAGHSVSDVDRPDLSVG